ncbi:molecular chaperone [Salmonella enterica subsp. salamae]|nr:molecular chaperone [Salmonella enterica subsp. salamae]ECJ2282163.1 molecular chaperone [Salmonella enterica subsp. salamae]HCC0889471.1 molecular chaperone [Salmonella enterica]
MKVKTALIVALLSGCQVCQSLAGGIVLQRTRVIYDASRKEAALPLSNQADKAPYLIQSWVEDTQGKRGAFIVTPPLFRLNAGEDSSLRIMNSSASLPQDKESLFYLNVRAIPALEKNQPENTNTLTLVVKSRIKLFYRPAHLKGEGYDAYKTIEFTRNNNTLNVYNPSAYYVVFAGLSLGNTDLTNKIEYIAPGETKHLSLPATTGNEVKWAAINDYGASSKTESRKLE